MADALSVEELEALLQKKKGSKNLPVEEVKKCSFKSTKSPYDQCEVVATTMYGDVGYCKDHTKSVQAKKSKKSWEENKSTPTPPPTREPTPPPLVEESLPKEEAPVDLKRPLSAKKKVRKNQWGNFEDLDTNIVFSPDTKAAYGVQDHKTGKVVPLKDKHIEICKKYGWPYHEFPESEDEDSDDELDDDEEDGSEEQEDDLNESDESQDADESQEETDDEDE